MKKILLFILFFVFSSQSANSLIKIDITRGNLDPLPIAVSPLHIDPTSDDYKSLKDKKLGENISEVIERNFKSTGLFNPLKKDAFVQKPDIAHLKPRFEDWRLIKAQALVTGKILLKDKKLKVEFRLWDLTAAKEMVALSFTTDNLSSLITGGIIGAVTGTYTVPLDFGTSGTGGMVYNSTTDTWGLTVPDGSGGGMTVSSVNDIVSLGLDLGSFGSIGINSMGGSITIPGLGTISWGNFFGGLFGGRHVVLRPGRRRMGST